MRGHCFDLGGYHGRVVRSVQLVSLHALFPRHFIQHLLLWKIRLRMRTMVELERIIWRTSKVFVFGNAYNVVLARKPVAPFDISC
jgi:hypothetical protein